MQNKKVLDLNFVFLAVLFSFLILLFYYKSSVNKENYHNVIERLNNIKQYNSEMYGDIFLVKYNKIKHYDYLLQNMKNIEKEVRFLKDISSGIKDQAFIYNLDKLEETVSKKSNHLNSFISHLAVYKNFMSHLPNLSNDLIEYFSKKDSSILKDIVSIQKSIILHMNGHEKFNNDLLEKIDKKYLYKLEKKDKEIFSHFIIYSKKTIEYIYIVDELEKDLISYDIEGYVKLLSNNYISYFSELEKSAEKYLFFMMISSFLLIGLIIFILINLRKANIRIKNTLTELNFQKSALDEHAIVSVTDAKGNITYVNQKFCDISGYLSKELIGKNHRILKSDEHEEEFFKTLWFVVSNGKTWRGEVKNRRKDGSFYWVSATVVPLLDEYNRPFKYISIRTDITKRKTIETDLIEAKIQADESNRTKSEFLANMSHELRTPLNGVIGMAHIALENEKNKKQKNYLEKIDTSANILLKIINDLLDYSKIEAGKLSIEKNDFNIDGLLQSVADLVSVKAYEKDLELLFNRDMKIPKTISGDSLRISQILVNIIGNSIKFTESGMVSLNLAIENKTDKKVDISFIVKDTGIGMDEKTLNTVFNSFAQADASTSRKYGGTGLGLTITKNLVELMDGNIKVESKVGLGTSFIVTIPFEYKVEEENINFNLTKDVEIILYKISSHIEESLDDILSSLKISSKKVDSLNDVVKNTENIIIFTEDKDSVQSLDKDRVLYISNPNISYNSSNDNIKVIMKPINPSLIYDSILEFMHIDNSSFGDVTTNKVKSCKGVNVLLVEDNEINQLVATTFLDTFGCNYKIANNGQEALDIINDKSNSFDIIFMDVQMPIMNGYDATKILRNELNITLPIVAMTANAMNEDIEKCLAVGMNRHIGKPIDPNEIEKAIMNLVRK